ncbi:MAG: ribbon-helix-helix protein, CopG family [Candidatus Aminicenantes bacterium]
MNDQENTPKKMKSLSIKLTESLLDALDEMARDTGFDGKEELVSFLAQEVFSGESSLVSPGEDYKIKRKLRSLGDID